MSVLFNTVEVVFFETTRLDGGATFGVALSDDPDRGSEEIFDEWQSQADFLARFPDREAFETFVRTETGHGACLQAGAALVLRGDPWAGEALRRQVEALGWDDADLDELVHENKAAEAANINNAGLVAQCAYLARCGVKIEEGQKPGGGE